MWYGYLEDLSHSDRVRFSTACMWKLTALSAWTCPCKILAGSWVDDPMKWPEIEWPDVAYHVIETPGGFSRESMRNRRSLEAHNQCESGWVRTVLDFKSTVTESHHCVLKADIIPPQRVNGTPYHHGLICTKMTGLRQQHTVIARLGKYSHQILKKFWQWNLSKKSNYCETAWPINMSLS